MCLLPINTPAIHPPKALVAFIKLLEQDGNLQAKVKAADNPQQIIEIAESTGCAISRMELRTWSAELAADYYPWATQGSEFRRNFFKRKG